MDKERKDLLSIGRFAEASRLSLKALRLYDREGLLQPYYVDPRSGYRFYHLDQLEQARLILLLRQIDMPIISIKSILASPKLTARSLLEAYWRSVETRVETNRKIVENLCTLLQEEEKMVYPIQVKEIPQMNIIGISRKVKIDDLENYIGRSIDTLVAHAKESGAKIIEEPWGIYHGPVNEDSNGPVEICLPIDRLLQPTREIHSRKMAATKVAFTTLNHSQSQFPDILKAYDAVYNWIRQQRRKVMGPPWEIYVGNPKDVGPEDPFIEIAWPYR